MDIAKAVYTIIVIIGYLEVMDNCSLVLRQSANLISGD